MQSYKCFKGIVLLCLSLCVCKGERKDDEKDIKTTLETITALLSTHMDTTEKHFSKVYYSFKDLRLKFENLNKTQTEIKGRFDGLTTRLEALEAGQNSLTNKIEEIKTIMSNNTQCPPRELTTPIPDVRLRDECADDSHDCSPNANCEDQLDGYTCHCLSGYTGDGFSCTADVETLCPPPSALIEGLGCITAVPNWMTWENARQSCIVKGLRLLEGVTTQRQLNELAEKLGSYFTSGLANPWIGFYELQWLSNEERLNPSSSLWRDGLPVGENKCGYTCLMGCGRPSLSDFPCESTRFALCQQVLA